jgi:hypothetical protein
LEEDRKYARDRALALIRRRSNEHVRERMERNVRRINGSSSSARPVTEMEQCGLGERPYEVSWSGP